MNTKRFKRISLWVNHDLYDEIKRNADASFLRVSTFLRQLIQQTLKNNITKNQ